MPIAAEEVRRWRMAVAGTVQGVGFRPHVHRLASGLGLSGLVGNDASGVFIEVEGPEEVLHAFRRDLVGQAPPLARIDGITTHATAPLGTDGFEITPSRGGARPVTAAPPDTAPCADCLRELADPGDRRHRYPFTTCTNCGPRFTIITALPYDRPATTMAGFPLCGPCAVEYRDPADRRFHAQPLACPDCGPQIRLVLAADARMAPLPTAPGPSRDASGRTRPRAQITGTDAVLASTQALLADGAIVAIKGIGGFHLACRADDEDAVARLRQRKHRPGKPFALMVADLDRARTLAEVSPAEAALLASPAAPIVLLRRRRAGARAMAAGVAGGVAPGNPLLGMMLPSSPLHHLLFAPVPSHLAPVPDALVMTSGNIAEEPLCTGDEEALTRLAGIADAWLLHDRPIAVACDDSVVRVDGDTTAAVTVIRRSRGYVPTPLRLPRAGVPTLAVGGHLKTTTALTDGHQVWLSQHIGDMGSLATLQAFERTIGRFGAMHEVAPQRLVADAHPEYATRRWAHGHADGRRVVEVQHHHAHIAAVMAEHGLDGARPVVGIAFDGTGYGPDGTIWGGEALLADYDGFRRLAHLSHILLPGGDAAIRHPRRTALSHLTAAGIAWSEDLPPVRATDARERRVLTQQLARGVHSAPTSSMGRLFDALASLLGVRHDITFEAQAAIELEVLAGDAEASGLHPLPLALPLRDPVSGAAATAVGTGGSPAVWDATVLVRGVVAGLRAGAPPASIALGVHHAIADAVRAVALRARDDGHPDVVALSGGVFTNALLTRLVTAALERRDFEVLRHHVVPPNDGGLALGQIVVGSRP